MSSTTQSEVRDPETLVLAGDTHGNLTQWTYLIAQAKKFDCDTIFQLGDFGLWVHTGEGVQYLKKLTRMLDRAGLKAYWLDGNHENHTLLRELWGPGSAGHKVDHEGFWHITHSIWYAPRGHRWEWHGVKFLSLGGAYCVDPETPVLTADLRWVMAGDLREGDELIGFDEDINCGPGRNITLKPSLVEASGLKMLPTYRVTTDDGDIVCSEDHQLVMKVQPGQRPRQWRRTADLRPGNVVQWLTKPWEPIHTYNAGWLAGLLDGEGWLDSSKVSFGQNPGSVLTKGIKLLEQMGFDVAVYQQADGGVCQKVTTLGGKWESLRLLGQVRPTRLLEKASSVWNGQEILGKGKETQPGKGWSMVRSVEYLGVRENVTMQTSSRTFIANGFLSHNSIDKEWRLQQERGRGTTHSLWWPEELITDEEEALAIEGGKVDTLLTHDVPYGIDIATHFALQGKRFYKDDNDSLNNRLRLRRVVDQVHPRYLFHGHMHLAYSDDLRLDDGWEVRVEGLGCDGMNNKSFTVVHLKESATSGKVVS